VLSARAAGEARLVCCQSRRNNRIQQRSWRDQFRVHSRDIEKGKKDGERVARRKDGVGDFVLIRSYRSGRFTSSPSKNGKMIVTPSEWKSDLNLAAGNNRWE